ASREIGQRPALLEAPPDLGHRHMLVDAGCFEQRWTLTDLARRTGGPARYVRTDEGGTIGFITPLTRNFCDGCNRVRVTCSGQMYLCLGQPARADLKAPLRASPDDRLLDAAIDEAIGRKPRGHDFVIRAGSGPAVERPMSVTGG
ncbi:MAG TPA: hypothetical protein VEW25_10320, partial [Allosphingosinicella sp.]|nr:hypothetical protein [Allosphingosinicella sp.]